MSQANGRRASRATTGRGRDWRWLPLAGLLVCAFVWSLDVTLSGGRPVTWSLAYGIAATVLLVVLMLYGARRRAVSLSLRLRLGSARLWLQLHLAIGLLFLALMLMHSEFRLPNGTLTWWLWLTSIVTVASGLVGLGLQRWIPRVHSSGLAVEVLYHRIPELIDQIRSQAEELVAGCDEPVKVLYAREMAPALAAPRRRLIYFFDITGGIQGRLKPLRYLGRFLSSQEKEKLGELEGLLRTKLEIDAHYTLQRALRQWLYFHLPLSFVLCALVLLHLFAVLYY